MKKISLMILLLSFSLTFVACSNDVTKETNDVNKETILKEVTTVEDTTIVKGDEKNEMSKETKLQKDYQKALNSMKVLTKEQLKLSEELSAYQIMCGKEYVEYNEKDTVEVIVMKDLGDRMETVNIYYYDAKIDKFYLYDAVTDTVSSLRPER